VEARPQLRVEAARQMAWRRVEAQRRDRSEHQRQHRGSHQTKNLIDYMSDEIDQESHLFLGKRNFIWQLMNEQRTTYGT
jgi:hypothetical protein